MLGKEKCPPPQPPPEQNGACLDLPASPQIDIFRVLPHLSSKIWPIPIDACALLPQANIAVVVHHLLSQIGPAILRSQAKQRQPQPKAAANGDVSACT